MTDRISTHADGCWSWGQEHYECAVMEIKALRADLAESDEIREKLGHLLTRTATYVRRMLAQEMGLRCKDIPQPLVEAQRELLKIKRYIREHSI